MTILDPKVCYYVDLNCKNEHIFLIHLSLNCANKNQKFSLPAWTPGSYMVRDFAQHIVSIEAKENGQKILVSKTNKNTFMLNNKSSEVEVIYKVYGFDSSIRASYIDANQAFFNGTALFLRPHNLKNCTYFVDIKKPNPLPDGWQVACNMPKFNVDDDGFGFYSADSFTELVDYPFQISSMTRLKFDAMSIPHEIVLVSDIRKFDQERLIKDLKTMCEYQLSLFESKVPFANYIFIARFEEGGYGGLEHRNSSMLLASPDSLPGLGLKEADPKYQNFLSLCAHEYFHSWNIKKLKPHSFVDMDLEQECYTTMLWFFEGITAYYDDLIVKRSGLVSDDQYLKVLAQNYTALLKTPGRHVQSLAESSYDAWLKLYRRNENSPNSMVSYYLKGSFIGLFLDLSIRESTDNQKSLDHVMNEAVKEFPQGITEKNLFDIVSNICPVDIKKYIYDTAEIPIEELLRKFGIEVKLEQDKTYIGEKAQINCDLGFRFNFSSDGCAYINYTKVDGPAIRSGLCPQDEILSINSIRFDKSTYKNLLSSINVGDVVNIIYARKKVINYTKLISCELPKIKCTLKKKSDITPDEVFLFNGWLGNR